MVDEPPRSSDREEFFAACDHRGILVRHDFPNAWWMGPPDRDVFVQLFGGTVLRYRIHPCVAVRCGADDAPLRDRNLLRAAFTRPVLLVPHLCMPLDLPHPCAARP
ncbi:hypothetical protein [Streptomyces sp. OP7]|uniref:hypothetical protein n=1 Tax=Streptomyces sp. OP7 TaxID=3142462 RepID=UPI0032E92795